MDIRPLLLDIVICLDVSLSVSIDTGSVPQADFLGGVVVSINKFFIEGEFDVVIFLMVYMYYETDGCVGLFFRNGPLII